MRRIETLSVLPHEWAFGAFLAITWGRLVGAAGWLARDSLVFLGLVLGAAVLILWCRQRESTGRWRLRLWYYPLAMNLAYFALRTAAPRVHPQLEDAVLQRVDALLVGRNLSLRLEGLVHPALTEFMSFCYFIYFPYLLFCWIYYDRQGLPLMKRFFTGFFTAYGIGLLGYTVLPAVGPYLDPGLAPQFTVPLHGWFLTTLNDQVVVSGSNRVDCFPSLHCAVSCYVLLFDLRHRAWRFTLYVAPAVGLWLATLYLRYHYFTDLVAGFALAAFCLWLVRSPRKEQYEIPAPV